jgi:hypothetical protein
MLACVVRMKPLRRWARLRLPRLDWVLRLNSRSTEVGRGEAESLPHELGAGGQGKWPQVDQPISSSAADRLGRGPFARRAAQVLSERQSLEESSVVALVGPWGSGKSSLINLICEELGEPWRIRSANMWAPPDVAALLADLFATIRSALPEGERAKRLKHLLAEYAQLAIPALTVIPVVGDAAGGVVSNLVSFRARRPMQPLFDQLTAQLREFGLRVLVVLDDVDRLQPDELLILFKAIRLVARFPGVYYLLAYDEQTVIDVLTSTPIAQGRPERALAYLEKIVQVRLDLPPAQRYYTEKMLSDGITDLLDGLGMVLSDEQAARFRELYDTVLRFTLSQPRAVGRFLRQAVAYLPMTEPGEFDVVDFLALTHLRSLSPGTYQVLARSKASLTGQPGSNAGEGSDTVRALLVERIHQECGDIGDQVLAAVTELFPAIDAEYLTRLGPVDWQQRAAARRASVEEYFDRYFLFGLPADDIADSTARDALVAIALGEETPALLETRARITGPDPGAASRVIGKLARFSCSTDVVDATDLGEVLRFALSLPGKDNFPVGDALLGSAEHQGITWASALLMRICRSGMRLQPELATSLDDAGFSRLCQALRQAVLVPGLVPGEQDQALMDTYDQVAEDACERVRGHLRQRDQASLVFPVGLLAQFINRSAVRGKLAGMISADLDDGLVALDDLASRFVMVGRFSRKRDEVIGFDDQALVSLMGLSRLWKLAVSGHYPDAPDTTADEQDTSWPGLRRAGLTQLVRTLRQQRAAPPRPPSGVDSGMGNRAGQGTGPRQWASRIQTPQPGSDNQKRLLCIRAAVLLPGSAQGLPNGQGSAAIFEEVRAQALVKILALVPLTAWCLDTARSNDLQLGPDWTEEGFGSRTYAELALRPAGSDTQPPLSGYCAITTGSSSRPGDPDILALALDLLLHFPFQPDQGSADHAPAVSGDSLNISQLAELTEMVTRSAIQAARKAAAELLHTSPDDGHIAIWLNAPESLERVIDLNVFPAVGNQAASPEVVIFADLPLEPGQAFGSADFTTSLRAVTVELIHELFRTSRRRNFTETLHALRDNIYD